MFEHSDNVEEEITLAIRRWCDGEDMSFEEAIPELFDELLRLARLAMRSERIDHTLQPTALVNELYLSLVDSARRQDFHFENRSEFFAFAATVLRRILARHARGRNTQKRGGRKWRVDVQDSLLDSGLVSVPDALTIIQLDEALSLLDTRSERAREVAEYRIILGLGEEEIAKILCTSTRTVRRDWQIARLFLASSISNG